MSRLRPILKVLEISDMLQTATPVTGDSGCMHNLLIVRFRTSVLVG